MTGAIAVDRVTTEDGVSIAVRHAGPADAPGCVFVHGIAQSARLWDAVLGGPLARELRLVAIDLRGHGDSDRPEGDAYTRPALAGDLAAVLDGLGLVRPALVVSSYGGVVAGEYLRRHGEAGLGALVFAAGSARTGREAGALFGPVMMDHARALLAEDPVRYEAGARAFLAGCTAAPLPPAAFEEAVADMLRVPARVRRPLLAGGEDYTPELARTTIPLATLHGELDRVVLPAMSEQLAGLRPGVTPVWLAGLGHLPWLEAPARFADALRPLVTARSAAPR